MKRFDYTQDGFDITKWGGGLAYTVTRGNLSFFVQGDDALRFESDLDAANEAMGPYGAREFLTDQMEALGEENPA